ncbi:hypothetical protein F4703DRAFT_1927933 [Phycomyces blakesleeanus]
MIMDERPEMKGYFVVIYYPPTHILKVIDPIIMKRDYTPVYLPLITCLTLIQSEKSWAIVKGNIKRNKSSGIESFAMHIIEASEAVPVENLRGSIQHFTQKAHGCLQENLHNYMCPSK